MLLLKFFGIFDISDFYRVFARLYTFIAVSTPKRWMKECIIRVERGLD